MLSQFHGFSSVRILFFLLFFAVVPLSSDVYPACADFYYIKRPLTATPVLHEFIGIHGDAAEVAGLPKTSEDLTFFSYFLRHRATPPSLLKPSVHFLGRACGQKKVQALKTAKERSNQWKEAYDNWALYLLRMGLTPVLGKPCRKAALDVAEQIKPWLS